MLMLSGRCTRCRIEREREAQREIDARYLEKQEDGSKPKSWKAAKKSKSECARARVCFACVCVPMRMSVSVFACVHTNLNVHTNTHRSNALTPPHPYTLAGTRESVGTNSGKVTKPATAANS